MIGPVESFLLFLPLFLAVNIVAAAPGRESLRDILRAGLRHFVIGTVILVAASAGIYLLMEWVLSRPPLF